MLLRVLIAIIVQLWFQSGVYTQSETLNFDSSQQEYQVLAEWDKESSEGDSTSTGANTETSHSQAKTSPHSLLQTTIAQPGRSSKQSCV